MRYKAALLSLVGKCRAIVAKLIPGLKASWPTEQASADGRSFARDAGLSGAQAQIKSAAGKLGNLDKWSKRMVGLAVEANKDNVDERLAEEIRRVIGIDVSAILRSNSGMLKSMKAATKDNIALIKTIPEQYFDRVTKTVTDGWTQGMRWETLVEQIQRDGSVTDNRAKLIARDQTSKMNAAFNQERQQQVGIEKYEWSTSKDERVRESHADMDGEICEWANPPIVDDEPAHPGEPVSCRCTSLPIVDEALLSGAFEEAA
jgi:SPP1 gp7 family putative phage head morphogenesis protein